MGAPKKQYGMSIEQKREFYRNPKKCRGLFVRVLNTKNKDKVCNKIIRLDQNNKSQEEIDSYYARDQREFYEAEYNGYFYKADMSRFGIKYMTFDFDIDADHLTDKQRKMYEEGMSLEEISRKVEEDIIRLLGNPYCIIRNKDPKDYDFGMKRPGRRIDKLFGKDRNYPKKYGFQVVFKMDKTYKSWEEDYVYYKCLRKALTELLDADPNCHIGTAKNYRNKAIFDVKYNDNSKILTANKYFVWKYGGETVEDEIGKEVEKDFYREVKRISEIMNTKRWGSERFKKYIEEEKIEKDKREYTFHRRSENFEKLYWEEKAKEALDNDNNNNPMHGMSSMEQKPINSKALTAEEIKNRLPELIRIDKMFPGMTNFDLSVLIRVYDETYKNNVSNRNDATFRALSRISPEFYAFIGENIGENCPKFLDYDGEELQLQEIEYTYYSAGKYRNKNMEFNNNHMKSSLTITGSKTCSIPKEGRYNFFLNEPGLKLVLSFYLEKWYKKEKVKDINKQNFFYRELLRKYDGNAYIINFMFKKYMLTGEITHFIDGSVINKFYNFFGCMPTEKDISANAVGLMTFYHKVLFACEKEEKEARQTEISLTHFMLNMCAAKLNLDYIMSEEEEKETMKLFDFFARKVFFKNGEIEPELLEVRKNRKLMHKYLENYYDVHKKDKSFRIADVLSGLHVKNCKRERNIYLNAIDINDEEEICSLEFKIAVEKGFEEAGIEFDWDYYKLIRMRDSMYGFRARQRRAFSQETEEKREHLYSLIKKRCEIMELEKKNGVLLHNSKINNKRRKNFVHEDIIRLIDKIYIKNKQAADDKYLIPGFLKLIKRFEVNLSEHATYLQYCKDRGYDDITPVEIISIQEIKRRKKEREKMALAFLNWNLAESGKHLKQLQQNNQSINQYNYHHNTIITSNNKNNIKKGNNNSNSSNNNSNSSSSSSSSSSNSSNINLDENKNKFSRIIKNRAIQQMLLKQEQEKQKMAKTSIKKRVRIGKIEREQEELQKLIKIENIEITLKEIRNSYTYNPDEDFILLNNIDEDVGVYKNSIDNDNNSGFDSGIGIDNTNNSGKTTTNTNDNNNNNNNKNKNQEHKKKSQEENANFNGEYDVREPDEVPRISGGTYRETG